MPDHLHAIIFPQDETTISEVMRRFKLSTFQKLRTAKHRNEPFWQSRFNDHALRTRREFDDVLDYMHMNPVRKGLVADPAAWPWSSARWFEEETGPVRVDTMRLPFDPQARI
jgi:putative transposase